MRTVFRRTLTVLLATSSLAIPVPAAARASSALSAVPSATSPTSTFDTAPYRCDPNDRRDWYKQHPTQTGQICVPGAGWGKVTTVNAPGRNFVVPFDTPYFTTATSLGAICTTEELLRTPVMRSSRSAIPTRFDVGDQVLTSGCRRPSRWVNISLPAGFDYLDNSCWVLDPLTVLRGYEGRPCEHRNRWLTGPRGGFSICDLKSCETTGHQAQGGYYLFLAHKETWSYVGWDRGGLRTQFVPCGIVCGPTPDPTCEPSDPDCPTPDPTCEPSDPDCPSPDPGTTPDPGPICTDPSCAPPPPRFCDANPTDPRCRPGDPTVDLTGVRIEVTLDVPAVYATKGTLLPQGASVRSIALICGDRSCTPGDDNLDPSLVSLTGRLVLRSGSATYRECATSRTTGCAFYPTATDDGATLRVGDRVLAAFFTPTRSGQRMLVSIDDVRGVIRRYARVPVYEWTRVTCTVENTSECRAYGYYYAWVPGSRTERAVIGDVDIPVVVRDSAGTTVPAAGLPRQVIGSIGD